MITRIAYILCVLIIAMSALYSVESGMRQLFSFETADEIKVLQRDAENMHIIPVLDAGVTHGKLCARLALKKGQPWSSLTLGTEAIKKWSGYDYFAMDLYTNEVERHTIHFELLDKLSKNYQMRCSNSSHKTHEGKQTILIKINRAKRNGKEGRSWEEAQPADKIAMDALTKVKIFFTPDKDRDVVLWVDNMRLLTEEEAFPKFTVPVPENSFAFDFTLNGTGSEGCTQVDAETRFGENQSFGFAGNADLQTRGGKGWPDALSGSYVRAKEDKPLKFIAQVPNGNYKVLFIGGRIYNNNVKEYAFKLSLNDDVLVDEKLSKDEYYSEKHYYRFLRTQFSLKKNALWHDYISHMYPAVQKEVEVSNGELKLEAVNFFASSLIIVPVKEGAAFNGMLESIQQTRIDFFEKSYFAPERQYPVPASEECTVFVPTLTEAVLPWTRATDPAQKPLLKQSAAKGQTVYLRLAITAHKDLGRASLELSDLKGSSVLTDTDVRWYFANYRFMGDTVVEGALLPAPGLMTEKGITLAAYVRLRVPSDAVAGDYSGTLRVKFEKGTDVSVPVSLSVHPFALEQTLPVSYGMYYEARRHSDQELREQFAWMREIGFTAVSVGAPRVTAVNTANGSVSLQFNRKLYDMVKESGMGAHPDQKIMATALSVGRSIGRKLPGSSGAKVDQDPGIELRQPEFKALFLNAMKQYKEFIDSTGLPVAVEVVDEPREFPNPWNRNLADTIAYAKMQKQSGVTRFITPMTDGNSGLDYTPLIDNTDIISVHAWKRSEKLLKKAAATNADLWLYNTGQDRYSWGFYNWRMNSKGRWEWHFRWTGGNHYGEYPGNEWHNPFTKTDAFSTAAPATKQYPGSMVFKSQYFDIAEGINDYAYLYTLEQRIAAAEKAGSHKQAVLAARNFLGALREAMPMYPKVKGLEGADSGALLGQGISGEASKNTEIWRSKLVEYILAFDK